MCAMKLSFGACSRCGSEQQELLVFAAQLLLPLSMQVQAQSQQRANVAVCWPRIRTFHMRLSHMQYVAWLELVLMQVLFPQSSFMGHLCGIVAGPELPSWTYEVLYSTSSSDCVRHQAVI